MRELTEFQQGGQTKLMSMRNSDGGWAWFCASGHRETEKSNPYWTARVLLSLHEIKRSGIPVNDATLHAGIEFLLTSRNTKGLYAPQGIFFCSPGGDDVDMTFTADIFCTMVEIARNLDEVQGQSARLKDMCEIMATYLKGKPNDPMAVARAAYGLRQWSLWQKDQKYLALVRESLNHLHQFKKDGRWHGSVYRSDVLVNAAIAEFLFDFQEQVYTKDIGDVVNWLVSQQTAWGGWGTTLDTAMAIRAVLKITSGMEQENATVQVKVNDKTVATVAIDPKDSFFSAVNLRNMEITPHLKVGENKLEVFYDGKLKAPALLETRQWTARPHRDNTLLVKRTAPTEANVGDLIPVTLDISTSIPSSCLVVEERLPANFTLEERSVRELVAQNTIAEYKLEKDRVFFYLHQMEKNAQIHFHLIAIGEGKIRHPGTFVVEMYDESIKAACTGGDIVITGDSHAEKDRKRKK